MNDEQNVSPEAAGEGVLAKIYVNAKAAAIPMCGVYTLTSHDGDIEYARVSPVTAVPERLEKLAHRIVFQAVVGHTGDITDTNILTVDRRSLTARIAKELAASAELAAVAVENIQKAWYWKDEHKQIADGLRKAAVRIRADLVQLPVTVDAVQQRMDAVVDAAVEWHQAGREGAEWFDKAEVLEKAIDSLLELRQPSDAECPCGTTMDATGCPNGHDTTTPVTVDEAARKLAMRLCTTLTSPAPVVDKDDQER